MPAFFSNYQAQVLQHLRLSSSIDGIKGRLNLVWLS
jgi:hypothetical protein